MRPAMCSYRLMAAYCWSMSLKPRSMISVGTLGMLRAAVLASAAGDVSSARLPLDWEEGWSWAAVEGRRCFWAADESGASSAWKFCCSK